jgi:hypothetical protein
MNDEYPLVDADYLTLCIQGSSKIDTKTHRSLGNTSTFMLIGDKPMYKKQVSFRHNENKEVSFNTSTSLAIRLGFMAKLLDWFEENKSWKEGAYVQRN